MTLSQKQRDSLQQVYSQQPKLILLKAAQSDLEAVIKELSTISNDSSSLTLDEIQSWRQSLQAALSRLLLYIDSAESKTPPSGTTSKT